MKVFVSWSRDSKAVAELFDDWLPKVIHEVDVWVSQHDIEPGEKWFAVLSKELAGTKFGLSLVTKHNVDAPWLLFEAGAIAKTLDAKATPVLCDLAGLDISTHPMGHLNWLTVNQADIWRLVSSVNRACERPLDKERLEDSFNTRWSDFWTKFEAIKFGGDEAPKPTQDQRLERIENALETILRWVPQMPITQRASASDSFRLHDMLHRVRGNDPLYVNIDGRAIAGTSPDSLTVTPQTRVDSGMNIVKGSEEK